MSTDLAKRIVGFYRAWQTLAAGDSAEAGFWVLVDDLCFHDVSTPVFKSKAEADAHLQRLIREADSLSGSYAVYTREKLAQSLLYLRQAAASRVSRSDIEARGIPWFVPTKNELQGLREETRRLRMVAEVGLRSRGEDPQKYFGDVLSPTDAATFLQQDGDFWLAQAANVWGISTADIAYQVVARNLNASFQNLVITEGDRIKLILNSSINGVFTQAHLRFLAIHEILGHVLHFTRMRQNTELQRQAPHLLCIAIHTMDAMHVEGVAQILSEAMIKALPGQFPEVACQVSWGNLFMAVRHRNICRLIANEVSCAEAAAEHVELIDAPPSRVSALTEMYEDRLTDPFACIQGLAYYASLQTYKHWLQLEASAFAARIDKLFFGYLVKG